ncbi:hypothetical protein IJU97_05115 [bacterium]|nr:hypothetical protein [bacterium]
MCTSNGLTDEGNFFAPAIEYEKETFSFKKAKYSSSCREEYKEKCNVAELTDNILTQVLSEYFTIKEADIF